MSDGVFSWRARAPDRVADRQHVHAVHALTGHAVGLGELPDLGLGERAVGRGAHRVAVVLAEEQHRQLPERRQVHRLVELPLRHGAVAEVAHDHLVAAPVLDSEADAHCDGQVRPDDRVTAEEVGALVEQVHRAALALGEPVAAAEQLGHDPLGIGTLRQAVAVLAVRGDRVVVGPEHRGGADRHRLLADVEMEEPADLPERVRLGGLLLEAADQEHIAQQLPRDGGIDAEA